MMMSAPMLHWMSGRLRAEQCLLPSMWLLNVTPSSVILRRSKTEHLVAAAVRQNRSLPIHEFVQPARRLQHVGAGAEVQMVSIAQDDLRANVVAQIPLRHRFDCSCRSNRHENRRLDDPVVRCDAAGTCLGLRVFAVDLKVEGCHGAW